MLTEKLEIINYNIELDEYITQYTGLFYALYNSTSMIKEKAFKDKMLANYSLMDVSMYDFCVSDVETKKEQRIKNKENKEKEIEKLNKKLEKSSSYKRYKIINKIERIKRNLDKNI